MNKYELNRTIQLSIQILSCPECTIVFENHGYNSESNSLCKFMTYDMEDSNKLYCITCNHIKDTKKIFLRRSRNERKQDFSGIQSRQGSIFSFHRRLDRCTIFHQYSGLHLTEIYDIPDYKTTNILNFLNNDTSLMDRTRLEGAESFVKSKSNNSFLQDINPQRSTNSEVSYVFRGEISLHKDKTYVENNYMKLISVFQYSKDIYEENFFPSVLKKCIYIGKNLNIVPQKLIEYIEHKIFECFKLSLEQHCGYNMLKGSNEHSLLMTLKKVQKNSRMNSFTCDQDTEGESSCVKDTINLENSYTEGNTSSFPPPRGTQNWFILHTDENTQEGAFLVSYEDSPDCFPISSTISNDSHQDAENQFNKHIDMKPKCTEFFTLEEMNKVSSTEHDEVTELSPKKYQERNNRLTIFLEKIFPYNSIQYTSQVMIELYRDVLDLQKILTESEINVKEVILQYVRDKNLETKLLEILQKYSQKKIESEQKLHGIAHHLIEEQIQILKSFKESSQAHIEMLVNQKNSVEQENIILLKKLEKLHLKLKQCPEMEVSTSDFKNILLENNEVLRNKLTLAQHNVSELQTANHEVLHTLEQCTDELHSQKLEMKRQKNICMKHIDNLSVEKAHLCSELQKYKKQFQDASDIGNAIIQDIKNLKNKLDETGKRVWINWEKLKVEGATVAHVLSMSHSCIQELGVEVFNMYQDLKAQEKELFTEKDSNKQMQKVLKELGSDYSMLKQQSEYIINEKMSTEEKLIKSSEEINELKEQLSHCSQDLIKLETEIINLQVVKATVKEQELLKLQLEKQVEELKTEKQSMLQKLLLDEKNGRTMEVDLMKMTALLDLYETKNTELLKENQALQEQLEMTKKSLENLQNFPLQYEQLEKKYYKEIAEKDYVNQQLNCLKTQFSEFSDSKSIHNTQLQNLETEFKKISKENLEMKWEIKNLKNINQCLEHDNCSMLHRLEKEAAKQKHQMQESHSKAQDLGAQISAQEKEIEELKNMYLIQTSTTHSLQQECEEKKVIINKLEEKCNELNLLQEKDETQIFILNNKIQELENQITLVSNNNSLTLNSIKYEFEALETTLKVTQDDLNNTMIKLQEKEDMLISFQDNLQIAENRLVEKEHHIAENLRTIEILQNNLQDVNQMKNNYIEMQEMLKDNEKTMQERDKLREELDRLLCKIETLEQNMKELQNKNDTLVKYCCLQKEHIKGMKAQINKLHDYLSKANISDIDNIESDLHQITYELTQNSKYGDIEYEIEEYKFILDEKENGNEEKSRLQTQVMLLHELHKRNSNDLKHAKKTVKMQEDKITELTTQLNIQVSKRNEAEKEYGSLVEKQKTFMADVEALQERVQKETQNCLSLTEEHYNYEKEKLAKEASLLNTIKELKTQNERINDEMKKTKNENEDLQQAFENKQKEVILLKEKSKEMETRLSDYGRTLSLLAQEKRNNEQLENRLHLLTIEGNNLNNLQQLLQRQHENVTAALESSREELKQTREALSALEKLERLHTQEIHTIKEEQSHETSRLLQDIKLMERNKLEAEQIIRDLRKSEESLHEKKNELSLKLLKALRLIYQTRMKFKIANEKIHDLSLQITNLREQKAQKEAEVLSLSNEITVLNGEIKEKNSGPEKLSSEHQLQEHISTLKMQVEDLQSQLLKAKHKMENDSSKAEALMLIKEDTIFQYKEQIHILQDRASRLRSTLTEAQDKLLQQNQEHSKLKCDIVNLQAEKRDLLMKLHVVEGYLNEEKNHRRHLEDTYNKLMEKN